MKSMGRPPLPPDVVRRSVTVRLPGALVDRAVAFARQHGGNVTDAVETALRLMLDGPQADARRADEIRAEVVADLRLAIDAVLDRKGA